MGKGNGEMGKWGNGENKKKRGRENIPHTAPLPFSFLIPLSSFLFSLSYKYIIN
jgi:hypothetical protein